MNNDQVIQQFRKPNGIINNNYKKIFAKLPQSNQQFITDQFTMYEDIGDKLRSIFVGDFRHCPECDGPMKWKTEALYCSRQCTKEAKIRNQKATNIERYGVENCATLDKFKQKASETCLERYGETRAIKKDEFKEKSAQTMMERYGVEYSIHNPESAEKRKNTMLERHGVEYTAQSEELREKMKQTNIERYGVDHALQNSEIVDKLLNSLTNLKIERIYEYTGITLTNDEANSIIFSHHMDYEPEYVNAIVKYVKEGIRPKFNLIRRQYKDTHHSTVAKSFGYDSSECEIDQILHDFGVPKNRIIRKTRDELFDNYELDYYIPSLKLALEFNGSYWHSDKFININYHKDKKLDCIRKGIDLIHIHEHALHKHYDAIVATIGRRLGKLNEINASDLRSVSVSQDQMNEFLSINHTSGAVNEDGIICVGLYDGQNIKFITTFKELNGNHYIIRYGSSNDCDVVDGLDRIVAWYKKKFDLSNVTIIEEVDYAKITKLDTVNMTKPVGYWVFIGDCHKDSVSIDYVSKLFDEDHFNPNITVDQNFICNKYNRIYTSGLYKRVV